LQSQLHQAAIRRRDDFVIVGDRFGQRCPLAHAASHQRVDFLQRLRRIRRAPRQVNVHRDARLNQRRQLIVERHEIVKRGGLHGNVILTKSCGRDEHQLSVRCADRKNLSN
jgi:hypothetical protein